jgi:hypothetical protein
LPEQTDAPALEGLYVCAGGNDNSSTFDPDRKWLADSSGYAGEALFGDVQGQYRPIDRAAGLQRSNIRRAEQEANVSWIDRSGLDPDYDFVSPWFIKRDVLKSKPKRAILVGSGSQLAAGDHVLSPIKRRQFA